MGLLASREVRWFVDDNEKNSAILRDWIEKRDPFDETGSFFREGIWKGKLGDREDLYAVIPNAEDMGIKWREGELQIKGRREDCGVQYFGRSVFGRVEQWLKWSYESESIKAAFMPWFNAKAERGPRIIGVTKLRALRKIWIDGKGKASEVSSQEAFPDRAVNVELTQLEVLGKRYWSLGLEAFPDDSGMAPAFNYVAERFLSRLEGIKLDITNTDSYPTWLSESCKRAETPIIPVILGETARAIQMSEMLLEEGVFVTGFGYPVVPQGHARVRCQVSTAHTREHLDFAIEAFRKTGRKLGVI
jgi:hypothetical protein